MLKKVSSNKETSTKTEEKQNLAQALRGNLRRRKKVKKQNNNSLRENDKKL
ncbi:MAG: hypothetical protein MRQ13_00060 [Candidatus Midichloria sp.]|nr:hypothetical protein [Candidatus Midichloria sp.]